MSSKQKRYSYLVLLLIIGVAFILTCTDKIINNVESNTIEFEMPLKFTSQQQQEIAEIVVTYQVTIIADEDTIVAELKFENGIISGLIENVPAGPNRIVIVEGLAADGTVIYHGTTNVTVVVGEIVDAEVILTAVGKIVRISPKYNDKKYGTQFTCEVKADNISGLTSIDFQIVYDGLTANLDSVGRGTTLPTGANFQYSTSVDPEIINANIDHSSPFVDTSGDVTLARLYFSPDESGNCLDSSILDLAVTALTAPTTTVNDVFVDDAWVRINRGKLILTPDALAFGAGVSGLNLDFKTVSATDSCGNAIPFTLSTESDWIDLNTAQAGLTPGTFFIDVDTTGLNSGHYEGFVRVSAPNAINSPFDIDVTLDIDKGARILDVLPDTLYFVATENDALPASQTFKVIETNGFKVNFSANESIPWLDISGVSGTTPDTITVSINSTALDFGTYNDSITISSEVADNSPQLLNIVYTVNKGPRVLAADPTELNFAVTEFGELPGNQTLDVIETGGYTIPYSATESISWLSLSGASGNTDGTVTASINTSSLSPGVYTDSIRISSVEANNSPIYVDVILTVTPATRNLEANPDTLYFYALQDESLPNSQTFVVSEVSDYPTSFSASENSNLFEISGISGNTPDTITVSILTTALEEGTYTDSIEITSVQAENSPQYVTVVYTVEVGERILAASPDSLHLVYIEFSDFYPTGEFAVSELGGYSIPFDLNENIAWLSLSQANGTTEDTVTVETQPEIGAGIYVDSIMVSSEEADNSPIFVVVTLEVLEAAKFLATDVDSIYLQYIEYSDVVPVGYINISEINDYTISFDATENADWLFLADIGAATPDQIQINVDNSFAPGFYVDSVMISSVEAENSPLFVKIVFEIINQPQPMLVVTPDTLRFKAQENGELPATDLFQVNSTLYQTGYICTETIDWLLLSDEIGVTGGFVLVDISSTALSPATYFDSIYVYSEDANFINTYEFIEYTVVDTIAPSAVADLSVDSTTSSSAFLGWTSSGDDANSGTAVETDLRYSTDLTILLDWTNATQVSGESSPQPAGSSEQFEVTNLTPGNTYYFGLDIIDNAGNNSGISNVDSIYIPLPAPDTPTLAAPTDGATGITINVTFVWNSADGADTYEIQYDTDTAFGSAVSNVIADTTLGAALDYETTYYWRVRASNSDAVSEWSAIWNFTTEPTPPTIAGLIRDGDGAILSDVKVIVYDTYPSGNKLDSTLSDQNGRFEFFDLDGSFELYSLKDGYYPLVTTIDAPDTNLNIFLIQQPQVNPSDQWVDFYCEGSAFSHGAPVNVNDIVEAYDPDGNLCGSYIVTTPGSYGLMPVYRDDPATTLIDEGCETGDLVTFKVNGETAITNLAAPYPGGINQQIEACFDVTGEEPKFIVISKPAGGETFYVDSSTTLEWSSIGISGQLVLYISNSTTFLIPLDTIDNDGEHTFVIPDVESADNWSLSLVDEDEYTTGNSNIFTISRVLLETDESELFFHSTVEGCLPGQKKFVITAYDSLNIPFEIEDTVSWLSVSPLSGTTPETITVTTLSNSLTQGTYIRSLPINAHGAHNSPISVDIEFEVGDYFCGDFDGDCRLNLADITNLVNFLYRAGPSPLYPEALNVDLCDQVDIADVDYLYNIYDLANPPICEGAEICTDVSNDLGSRDTLKFVVAQEPIAADSIPKLKLDLYLFNDINNINGMSAGFNWDNPNLVLDSVKFSQTVESNTSFRFAYEDNVRDTTNLNQQFLFAIYKTIFSGIPPSANNKLLATYYFSLSEWNTGDSITFDMLEFSPGTTLKASTSNGSYTPIWGGAVTVNE